MNTEDDSIIVISDTNLYVFGESTIEVIPLDLPVDHPFRRESDNATQERQQ